MAGRALVNILYLQHASLRPLPASCSMLVHFRNLLTRSSAAWLHNARRLWRRCVAGTSDSARLRHGAAMLLTHSCPPAPSHRHAFTPLRLCAATPPRRHAATPPRPAGHGDISREGPREYLPRAREYLARRTSGIPRKRWTDSFSEAVAARTRGHRIGGVRGWTCTRGGCGSGVVPGRTVMCGERVNARQARPDAAAVADALQAQGPQGTYRYGTTRLAGSPEAGVTRAGAGHFAAVHTNGRGGSVRSHLGYDIASPDLLTWIAACSARRHGPLATPSERSPCLPESGRAYCAVSDLRPRHWRPTAALQPRAAPGGGDHHEAASDEIDTLGKPKRGDGPGGVGGGESRARPSPDLSPRTRPQRLPRPKDSVSARGRCSHGRARMLARMRIP